MLTQAYRILYGAFEVGGSTGYAIHGPVRLARSLDRGSLSFSVVVVGTSDADLKAKETALLEAFSARRLRLRWLQGVQTRLDWDPAATDDDALGYDQVASATKAGTPGADSARSVLYEVVVEASLPVLDQDGLKDSQVVVTTAPSCVRTVVVSGTFDSRAEPTPQTAAEVYAEEADDLVQARLDLVDDSAVWKLRDSTTTGNDTGTMLAFSRTYVELVIDSGEAVPADPTLRDFALAMTEVKVAPGDSGAGIVRLREFLVVASATYCANDVPDPVAAYRSSMRGFILGRFTAEYAPTQHAVVEESVGRSRYDNGLSVVMRIVANVGATDVVSSAVSSEVVDAKGVALTGAWTGKPYSKYRDQGIGSLTRQTTAAQRVLGTVSAGGAPSGGGMGGVGFSGGGSIAPGGPFVPEPAGNIGGFGGGVGVDFVGGGEIGVEGGFQSDPIGGGLQQNQSGWVVLMERTTSSPLVMGQAGGEQITVSDVVTVTISEWVEAP